ncbi:hypothetical protein ACIOJD_23795 [Streptomyces sp. NPDC088116]
MRGASPYENGQAPYEDGQAPYEDGLVRDSGLLRSRRYSVVIR